MAPVTARPLTSTTVGAALLVKVAVPSGTVDVGDQLVPSTQSLLLAPVQVPSSACADTTPSADVASNSATKRRSAEPMLMLPICGKTGSAIRTASQICCFDAPG